MNNSMVAHLWAHEQEESASGSNFFFEGTSIYSYGYHFEVGRIVKNKQGKKAYLINEDYYSATTSKHQCYVRNAIPTWAMVFSVGDNISDTGNMRFVASKLESIKKSIEKYKRAKTELSYTDIWGAFGNMMDYIQFFNMGTAKSILKKSANDWLGTNHELSKSGDSIKRKQNENILSNMLGCQTYCISDSPSNRYCFIGPIECNGKLIEEFRKGIIVKLKHVEKRVLDTFKENGVDLDNYTHCVIVKRNFYLAW